MFIIDLLKSRVSLVFILSLLLLGCQSISLRTPDREAVKKLFEIQHPFRKVASFAVCQQSSCSNNLITSAEIISVSGDGNTLIYTDSPRNSVGFLDITTPESPISRGRLTLIGEPTSVTTKGNLALVVVNTSSSAVNLSGELLVIDISSKEIINSISLPGQPDSIAISPDKQYAAIAIENERSFNINNGDMPQLPEGSVVIVDLSMSETKNWSTTIVDITGLATQFPRDPEPEYVDINDANQVVVSLQENNHLIVIDAASSEVVGHFSAGSTKVDIAYDNANINRATRKVTAPREPDGISWLANNYIVTADEGGYYGGTDTVTIFTTSGAEVWSSENDVKRVVRYIGRENQTRNHGAQPENIEVGTFANNKTYLFANVERADIALVYDASEPSNPQLIQILDTPEGPEGGLAIPSRGLFIVASEEDAPDGVRSQIHIFQFQPLQ